MSARFVALCSSGSLVRCRWNFKVAELCEFGEFQADNETTLNRTRGEADGTIVAALFRLVRPLFRVEGFDFEGEYLRDAVESARLRLAIKL